MERAPILLVDDDENIRTLYSQALTEAGLTVLTAINGEEAVAIALREHPSVILIDILMPGSDGHKAVEKIRQDSWGKTSRIIFLTNLSDPKDVYKAVIQKPENYVVKANTDVKEVINLVRIAMHKEDN